MKYSDQTYTASPKLVLILRKWDIKCYINFRIIDKIAFVSWNFFWLLTSDPGKGEVVSHESVWLFVFVCVFF